MYLRCAKKPLGNPQPLFPLVAYAFRPQVSIGFYTQNSSPDEHEMGNRRPGGSVTKFGHHKSPSGAIFRAFLESWDTKCRLIFCCLCVSNKHKKTSRDIARILNEFFRDLDILPSDIAAGLALLGKFQQAEREMIVEQRQNDTIEFLSGTAITPKTKFLTLTEDGDLPHYQAVLHYMNFAFAAYSIPVFCLKYPAGFLKRMKCCCCPCLPLNDRAEVVEDTCCKWKYAAVRNMLDTSTTEIVYATFHNNLYEPRFFVAVDYARKKVVISIRGSLSIKDGMTGMNADSVVLPLSPPREDWLGLKGVIMAAEYIRKTISEKNLIDRARKMNIARGTNGFGVVVVGHSLGAATAAILAILLKQSYPELICFTYAPPAGLISKPVYEYSQEFITSVAVGEDSVPRVGLRQMENLRADILNALKRRVDSKLKTIACSTICGCCSTPTSVEHMKASGSLAEYQRDKEQARAQIANPSGSHGIPIVHVPLYPPGKLIHVVRYHPNKGMLRKLLCYNETVYQAIWARPEDFDEILISPIMFHDHMPDVMRTAMTKVSPPLKKFENLGVTSHNKPNFDIK